jgi:radical SAM protein with 4Fe4S-binding SPASM domain
VSFLDQILEEAFKDRETGVFPFSFGVEVTNFCNLRCPMCPREIADRGFGNMDWDLFTSLVDQAAEHEHGVLLPQGFGESFIHPRFREMLAYLKKGGRGRPVMLITNGTLFSDENIDAIIESGIELVNISLDGTVKEVFEEIRPNADHEEVVANVKRLLDRRSKKGSQLPRVILRMIKMDKTIADVAAFEDYWKPYLLSGDEIAYSNYQTWAGTVDDRRLEEREEEEIKAGPIKPPCRMLYKTMQVYFDGRVTPCCYDFDCTMEIGNACEAPIEAIWNGERAAHFRRLHEEGRMDEIPICKECKEYLP